MARKTLYLELEITTSGIDDLDIFGTKFHYIIDKIMALRDDENVSDIEKKKSLIRIHMMIGPLKIAEDCTAGQPDEVEVAADTAPEPEKVEEPAIAPNSEVEKTEEKNE